MTNTAFLWLLTGFLGGIVAALISLMVIFGIIWVIQHRQREANRFIK